MEMLLAILMAIGIFIVFPLLMGFVVFGVYILSSRLTRRLQRAGAPEEAVGEVQRITKVFKLLGNRSFQIVILALLCLYYPIIYYFGELIDHFGWEGLRWDFFYTVHDIHRVVFLIPILFAAYYFKIKGGVITTIFAFAVFLPRGLFLSQYPDPLNRMVVFTIFALLLSIFVGALSNKLGQLQHLIDSSNN
jgi:integral membrane sensor domain MASE1